jgi:hypothetical protein
MSFTLSQAGMVMHWLRERKADEIQARIVEQERSIRPGYASDPSMATHERERIGAIELDRESNWLVPAVINGVGAVVTFVVLIVIAVTKFTHGAWAVIIVIGLIVLMFRAINRHYTLVASQLSLDEAKPLSSLKHQVFVPVSGVHRAVLPALRYARSICGDGSTQVTALYVELNPEHTNEIRKEWENWGMGIQLKVIESPYRSLLSPLLKYILAESRDHDDWMTTIVIPEFIPRSRWEQLLHNQTALLIKGRLLFEKRIVVTSVPYHLRR